MKTLLILNCEKVSDIIFLKKALHSFKLEFANIKYNCNNTCNVCINITIEELIQLNNILDFKLIN